MKAFFRIITLVFVFISISNLYAGEQEDLFTACMQMDFAGVQAAVEDGADVNALNGSGHNALALAFLSPEITKYLLEKGCDPNGGKYPALIQACNSYSIEVAEMLLKAGADPNKKGIIDPSDIYRTLIASEEAKDEPNEAMIDAWSNLIGTQPTSETNALRQTVMQTNCVPALKLLIDNGVSIDIGEETTIFHILADYSNSPEMRKTRFVQGAPMMANFGFKVPDWYTNLPDEINGTATEMLDLLVTIGIDDINKPRRDGFTPLVIALKGLNPGEGEKPTKLAIAKGLIKHGADPKLTAIWDYGDGETTWRPICTAAEYGDVELIKMFLDAGVDINTSTETINLSVFEGVWGGEGYTPLIISIMFNNLDVAKFLVDQGADLINGTEGNTFLYGEHEGEKIKCFADVEDKTPIYWALEKYDLELVVKIADKIAGESHPTFSYEVVAAPEEIHVGEMRYFFERDEQNIKPSEYGWQIGNQEGGDYCDSLGL